MSAEPVLFVPEYLVELRHLVVVIGRLALYLLLEQAHIVHVHDVGLLVDVELADEGVPLVIVHVDVEALLLRLLHYLVEGAMIAKEAGAIIHVLV